jgi:hypothetical protein
MTIETHKRAVEAHAAVVRVAESYLLEDDRNLARVIWELTEGADSQIVALMDMSTALAVHLCTLLEMAAAEGPALTVALIQGIAQQHLESLVEEAIEEQPDSGDV